MTALMEEVILPILADGLRNAHRICLVLFTVRLRASASLPRLGAVDVQFTYVWLLGEHSHIIAWRGLHDRVEFPLVVLLTVKLWAPVGYDIFRYESCASF